MAVSVNPIQGAVRITLPPKEFTGAGHPRDAGLGAAVAAAAISDSRPGCPMRDGVVQWNRTFTTGEGAPVDAAVTTTTTTTTTTVITVQLVAGLTRR